MSSDLNVYSKLYDIVETNMRENGLDMSFGKNAYLKTIELKPKDVDILNFIELCNEEFIQAAYIGLLRRIPDKKAVEQWRMRSNELSERDFQKAVINSLMKSEEFLFKGVIVHNNIYSENVIQQQIVVDETDEMPNLYVIKLTKLYHKMPRFIKDFARFFINKIV